MEVRFTKLDSENWRDFIRLSVSEEQRDFVDVNLFVIAEAGIEDYEPFGLYADDEAVAMAVFATLPDKVGMVHHFMVRDGFQRQGHGRKTMEELLKLAGKPRCHTLRIPGVPAHRRVVGRRTRNVHHPVNTLEQYTFLSMFSDVQSGNSCSRNIDE